jgi:hypothetical protein
MNNFKLFLLFLFFTYSSAFASDYIWPPFKTIQIPDSLKKEHAFFIRNTTTYDFLNTYKTSILYFKRIHVTTKIGVNSLSTYSLPDYRLANIEFIKSRIIKKDGSIVEITGENIKKTFIKGNFNYSKRNVKRIQFIYPGLAEGDVIDIAYKIQYDFFINSELLYLESSLPSLHSKITLRNQAPGLDISVFTVNSSAKYVNYDGEHSWEQFGVKSIKTDGFNALSAKSPRFYYSIIAKQYDLSYDHLYRLDTDAYPVVKTLETFKLSSKLEEIGIISESDGILISINKIIQEFKTYDWIDNRDKKNNTNHTTYFKDRKINEELFLKYIQHYLENKKIPYERCYSNSLLQGPFESQILAYCQLENRFIIIKDDSGNDHFIFPPKDEGHFYNLDEIPFYCEGNNAVLMSGTDVSIKNVATIKLPESIFSENKLTSQIRMKIQTGDSIKGTYSRKDVATGNFSNLLRINVKDEEDAYYFESFGISKKKVDITKAQSVFPYEIEIKQDSLAENCFQEIEDSLYWFDASSFIPEFVFEDQTEKDELGDYLVLPFKQLKICSFYIENDKGVSCQEQELSIVKSNFIGEISTKCVQVSPTMLKIEYVLKLKERTISSVEHVKDYLEFLQYWKEISTKKWVMKIS